MQKMIFYWMIAAILVCGASVLTSCNKDDDDSNKTNNISEKIIGKWMVAD